MVKATKDNRHFSSGVFDLEEFNIYTKVIDLPLDGIPTYLEEWINVVCTGGSALCNVFSNKRRVVKNDLITIFPYQLASITEISTDSVSYTHLDVYKRQALPLPAPAGFLCSPAGCLVALLVPCSIAWLSLIHI